MDQQLLKILIDLGIEEKQTRVYLALLGLGQAKVEEIAKRSGIKRTSLYFILEGLKASGLVLQSKIDRKTYYQALEPSELMARYQQRVNSLATKIDQLTALYHKSSERSRLLFFDSEDGFRQIWRIILKAPIKEYLIITDPRQMLEFVRKNYIPNQVIKEKVRRHIKSRQLIYPSEYAKEIISKDKIENRVSKFLPYEYIVSYTIIIFGPRVAFISPYIENIIFIAESSGLAQTHRALFEALWAKLPGMK